MLSETAAAAFCPELFTLPRNGSERNSESLLLFLLHGTEFRVVFSSAEGFGMEFSGYASIFGLRDGIPDENSGFIAATLPLCHRGSGDQH